MFSGNGAHYICIKVCLILLLTKTKYEKSSSAVGKMEFIFSIIQRSESEYEILPSIIIQLRITDFFSGDASECCPDSKCILFISIGERGTAPSIFILGMVFISFIFK